MGYIRFMQTTMGEKQPASFRFDAEVNPGEKRQFKYEVSKTYLGEPVNIQVTIINGEHPGPRVFMTAALHGDELNGVKVLQDRRPAFPEGRPWHTGSPPRRERAWLPGTRAVHPALRSGPESLVPWRCPVEYGRADSQQSVRAVHQPV